MTPATLTPRGTDLRRRPTRGGARDDPPRLWGDEGQMPDAAEARVDSRSASVDAVATFAERVADTWEALVAKERPSCLLCGGELSPRWSAGAGVVGGRCGDCGTVLE